MQKGNERIGCRNCHFQTPELPKLSRPVQPLRSGIRTGHGQRREHHNYINSVYINCIYIAY